MNAEKLKRLQAQVRIGGKGTPRRKKKVVHQTAATDDKKLQSSLKKLSVSTIPGIEEVNIIKDDLSVIHFNNPKAQASLSANTFAITGHGENKKTVEMLPEILPQLGQDTVLQLRRFASNINAAHKNLSSVAEEDDVPTLVGDFEEASKYEVNPVIVPLADEIKDLQDVTKKQKDLELTATEQKTVSEEAPKQETNHEQKPSEGKKKEQKGKENEKKTETKAKPTIDPTKDVRNKKEVPVDEKHSPNHDEKVTEKTEKKDSKPVNQGKGGKKTKADNKAAEEAKLAPDQQQPKDVNKVAVEGDQQKPKEANKQPPIETPTVQKPVEGVKVVPEKPPTEAISSAKPTQIEEQTKKASEAAVLVKRLDNLKVDEKKEEKSSIKPADSATDASKSLESPAPIATDNTPTDTNRSDTLQADSSVSSSKAKDATKPTDAEKKPQDLKEVPEPGKQKSAVKQKQSTKQAEGGKQATAQKLEGSSQQLPDSKPEEPKKTDDGKNIVEPPKPAQDSKLTTKSEKAPGDPSQTHIKPTQQKQSQPANQEKSTDAKPSEGQKQVQEAKTSQSDTSQSPVQEAAKPAGKPKTDEPVTATTQVSSVVKPAESSKPESANKKMDVSKLESPKPETGLKPVEAVKSEDATKGAVQKPPQPMDANSKISSQMEKDSKSDPQLQAKQTPALEPKVELPVVQPTAGDNTVKDSKANAATQPGTPKHHDAKKSVEASQIVQPTDVVESAPTDSKIQLAIVPKAEQTQSLAQDNKSPLPPAQVLTDPAVKHPKDPVKSVQPATQSHQLPTNSQGNKADAAKPINPLETVQPITQDIKPQTGDVQQPLSGQDTKSSETPKSEAKTPANKPDVLTILPVVGQKLEATPVQPPSNITSDPVAQTASPVSTPHKEIAKQTEVPPKAQDNAVPVQPPTSENPVKSAVPSVKNQETSALDKPASEKESQKIAQHPPKSQEPSSPGERKPTNKSPATTKPDTTKPNEKHPDSAKHAESKVSLESKKPEQKPKNRQQSPKPKQVSPVKQPQAAKQTTPKPQSQEKQRSPKPQPAKQSSPKPLATKPQTQQSVQKLPSPTSAKPEPGIKSESTPTKIEASATNKAANLSDSPVPSSPVKAEPSQVKAPPAKQPSPKPQQSNPAQPKPKAKSPQTNQKKAPTTAGQQPKAQPTKKN